MVFLSLEMVQLSSLIMAQLCYFIFLKKIIWNSKWVSIQITYGIMSFLLSYSETLPFKLFVCTQEFMSRILVHFWENTKYVIPFTTRFEFRIIWNTYIHMCIHQPWIGIKSHHIFLMTMCIIFPKRKPIIIL